MKKETLQLREILVRLINEIGDLQNIKSYPYTVYSIAGTEFETEYDKVMVRFVVVDKFFGDSFKYPPVLINEKSKYITKYNVEFTIDGVDSQYRKSDFNYLIRVLKTVTEIIKETILKNDELAKGWGGEFQNIYFFFSRDKHGASLKGDKQKDLLYNILIKNNLIPGYRVADVNMDTQKGFAITKINNK